MATRIALTVASLCLATSALVGCAGVGGSSGGSDLNKPGSWAYDGCRKGVLERVQRDHPQVTSYDVVGHVSELKQSGSMSVLSGEGKFLKGSDNFHFTFSCEVNRDSRQIEKVKYDKK